MRRRLAGVADVSISQHEQTAAVSFVPGTFTFSPTDFRSAIADAGVTVLTIDMEVCGFIEQGNVLRVSASDKMPTLQLLADSAITAGSVCITGRLDDAAQPYALEVTRFRPSSQ